MTFARAAVTAGLVALCTAAAAEDRALVIGINDYSAVPGAPVLTGAVRDADRMAELLTGVLGFTPEQITTLRDAEARHDTILSAIIDRLIGETRSGDRVVLYFAGLGAILDDGSPGIIAHDGETVVGHIPLETLASILSHISDREVTVLLDTGFETGPPGTRGFGAGSLAEEPGLGDGVALWRASEIGQYAWEDAQGGALTQAWIAGATDPVTDLNGNFAISGTELEDHVTATMDAWCAAHPGCSGIGQTLAPSVTGGDNMIIARLSEPEPETGPILTPIEEERT